MSGEARCAERRRFCPLPAAGKNILRGFFLAFLATFGGCFMAYTLPDALASQFGKVLPFWFYEGQTMLLAIGSCTTNFLVTALFR